MDWRWHGTNQQRAGNHHASHQVERRHVDRRERCSGGHQYKPCLRQRVLLKIPNWFDR